MSANIATTNGKAAIMYYGNKPWHDLGTKIEGAATAEEAILAAGLGYEVEKRPSLYRKSDGSLGIHPNHFQVVRTDDERGLGIVGKRLRFLQNKDAFRFMDAIVGIKGAHYHTAGALGDGERIWLLVKIPGEVRVIGDDVCEKYLLLSNAHDGSACVSALWTPIRVVCVNTLSLALGSANVETTFRMRHTSGMGLKVEEAQEKLGIISQRFSIFEEAARKLAATELTIEASKLFFRNVVAKGEPKAEGEELHGKTQKLIDKMSELFETGAGADLPGVKGTLWGAYNAVAEFADHYRGTNGSGEMEIRKNRLDATVFGTGRALKLKAWDQALGMAVPAGITTRRKVWA